MREKAPLFHASGMTGFDGRTRFVPVARQDGNFDSQK